MKKQFYLFYLLLFLSTSISAQTLLFDDFESGMGNWKFSTASGGNDYRVTALEGVNGSTAVRCQSIGTPNFMISPAVNFTVNKPCQVSFMSKSKTANSRKIEVYYNSSSSFNGNEVLIGKTAFLGTTYAKQTFDFLNPPAGVNYIILKGEGTGYVYMYVDNFEVTQTSNFKPTTSITFPINNATHIAGTSLPVTVNAADVDGTIAKVDLYYRGVYLATKTVSPYTFSVPDIAIGNSELYAIAYDNKNDSTISSIITVAGINTPPTCNLTSPLTDISINQGASVLFEANASDDDGTISQISFLVNGSIVFTDTTAPYSFAWSHPNAGSYTVTAMATDNTGLFTYSSPIVITSNATTSGVLIYENFENGVDDWALSKAAGGNDWLIKNAIGVSGTKCLRRQSTGENFIRYITPIYFSASTYTISLQAKAQTAGRLKFKAALVNGTDTIWSDVSNYVSNAYASYTFSLNCPVAGNYSFLLRCEATSQMQYIEMLIDDIIVSGLGGLDANVPPVVGFASPANAAQVSLNESVLFSANAYDPDGSIAKVEFYVGINKIGEVTSAPYTLNWVTNYPGVYSIKAVATDNNGKTSEVVNTLFVNYADRKVYDISMSSHLGGETNSGKVYGTEILSDGVIVLACDWGSVIPDGAVLHLLNGATIASRGSVVRLSADGKRVLSITKIGNYAVDISTDDNDNIYVAAGNSGMVKLNRLADQLIYAKVLSKNVYRIDAGKTGYVVILTRPNLDFTEKKMDKVTNIVLSPSGDILFSFGGASTYSNDVCIDETSQSVVVVGWKNFSTWEGAHTYPVDVPGYKIYSFSGIQKFEGYNWSNDRNSPNWLNRAENNMADSRISRCDIGQDGLLYFGAECSGGNHIFRYSPYDNMKKVRIVGGDSYHSLTNVGTEFHTFIGRINITNGNYIEGQSFTARLSSGKGNTLDMEGGNLTADANGRVYFTGAASSGTPLTLDRLPDLNYTGGAFIYIMNPTLQYRELVDRVIIKNRGRGIAIRKFGNYNQTIVYGGEVTYDTGKPEQALIYAKNPLQPDFMGTSPEQVSGFIAMIGGTTPAKYDVVIDGALAVQYAEGDKITLETPETKNGEVFSYWNGGGKYIADSTKISTTFSVPGKNVQLTPVYETSTSILNTVSFDFKIYQNSVSNSITIETFTNISLPLSLNDLNGRLLLKTEVSSSKSISLSGIIKGVYILTVGNTTKKLVVY
ncbi:MAG: T9SS type A sorting domain-containing protein [Paludibacter sp.]|nr:T9SS type A sorting domain-containing protein [Paludibacter sp.]